MDPVKKEATLEENVREVMQTLPPIIRRYLASGQYSTVARNLMKKYDLHVDQGGVLEREIMLLLMGIENPDEFAAALKTEAAISEDMLQQIMTDVNQEVFVPLREEERKAGMGNVPPPPIKVAEVAEVVKPVAPSVAAPAPVVNGGGKDSTNAPLPPKMIMPHPLPKIPESKERGQTSINQPKLLEDHEEPHIEFAPLPTKTTEDVMKASAPPNLPGTNIPVPELRPSPTLSKVELPPAPPAQPYSVDPYREPIE